MNVLFSMIIEHSKRKTRTLFLSYPQVKHKKGVNFMNKIIERPEANEVIIDKLKNANLNIFLYDSMDASLIVLDNGAIQILKAYYMSKNIKRKVFECNPVKNINCNKKSCYINNGPCHETKNKEYAKEDEPNDI